MRHAPPGFLTGSAGMAISNFTMGNIERGLMLLNGAGNHPLASTHHSLFYGMAGLGIAHLSGFGCTGDRELISIAEEYGEQLHKTQKSDSRGVC